MRKKNPKAEAQELGLYADNLGPSSAGLENDVYLIRQKFLVAIKRGRPKKELVNLTKHAAHSAARAYSKVFGSGEYAWQEIFTDKDLNGAAKYLYDSWEEESDVKLNPKRRKTMRKKKRSAKQLANDKRLGRMAKARHAAKRKKNPHKTVPRVARRKVAKKTRSRVKRTTSAKSHLWRVFRCRATSVMWLLMDSTGKWNWTSDIGKAILFATKKGAANVANGIARKRGYGTYQLGVVDANTTAAHIRAACTKGKI